MKPEEIHDLKAARESLCRRRGELAKGIASSSLVLEEEAVALTKILVAIEAIDRALNEAGQPYMSEAMRAEADEGPVP